MKGIVLAGGSGTRLYPITEAISKQLMPIYDKPMIYYPISVLMQAGIKDILIITTQEDQPGFKRLLGTGSKYGINLEYIIQPSPDGLAQAFTLGEDFIGNEPCAMVLGDNIFFGSGFNYILNNAIKNAYEGYATNFGYEVKDPNRFGIMEIDSNKNIISVEEKPENPKSDLAIVGLYFYPEGVSKMAHEVKPSKRGEYEITTLNEMYLNEGRLKAEILDNGFNWFDTGTFDSQLEAAELIRTYENNSDKLVSCLEAIGYENGWISDEALAQRAELLRKNSYGRYLTRVLEKGRK